MKKTEILAPVGNFEILKIAIEAGADAVYLAGKSFGARAYATNFSDQELIEAINYAHLMGIKVYVTVNTIILENEIDDALDFLDFLYLNDCDGVIVQDLGLSALIKTRYPGLRMHASTQMNIQTLLDAKVVKSLGFDRIILGREVSLETIKQIKENVDIELEVFVHGALCMSYSGNCYFSSLVGGRSGNRGRCAQPCRLPYEFLGNTKFYLSPKDLCTINNINEIAQYVDSLKIEGRMKSKEYVYKTVKNYKDTLEGISKKSLEEKLYDLKMTFNRSFTNGFINNESNSAFTNTEKSNHQGVLVGEVVDYKKDKTKTGVKLTQEIYMNDSIRIVGEKYEDAITLNAFYKGANLVKIGRKNDIIYFKTHKEMRIGDKVYLTKREEIYPLLKKISLIGKIELKNNELSFTISDENNEVRGSIPYEYSENDFTDRIKSQLAKCGDYVYIIKSIVGETPKAYVALGELNKLRRDLLEEMNRKRERRYFSRKIVNEEPLLEVMSDISYPEYSIAVCNEKQYEIIKDSKEDIYIRNKKVANKNDLYYYLPRVSEREKIVNKKTVASSLGLLGDVSSVYFNVCNSYTVRVLESLGVSKIGLSIELFHENINDLIKSYYNRYQRIPYLEVMIYGYYQIMYMKHCFVNKEKGYKKLNCGECLKELYLNKEFRIFGDEECHLALLYKYPVNLFSKVKELKEMGVTNFLLDFTVENEDEMKKVLGEYKDLNNALNTGYFGHYLKKIE